jgi:phospholipid/cholesterol/gamma-HCH transport system substrate-binding protein
MKTFAERNSLVLGTVGVAVAGVLVIGALQYKHLPFVDTGKAYSAYFAEGGGLMSGAAVQVSGMPAGEVSSVSLDGPRVLVKFSVDKDISLGERTEAAIKTKTLLGVKVLEVIPRGDGQLTTTIPVERTTSPYQLPDALGDLTATLSGLNTSQLSDSFATLAQTFSNTPPDLKRAVDGVARLSQTLNARDERLRKLLENANKSTAVLANRVDQVVSLITDSNALLAELRSQSNALDEISGNISYISRQLKGLVAENKDQLRPALDKVNDLLGILDNRKQRIQEALAKGHQFIMSLGEAVSSGPWFNAYLANLLPGQFLQPFVDAAFSDLGLDPNTLLPSKRVDPQTGQPATPALPVPFPRTGQGGEPRLTIPDAITGNLDPRLPLQFPGRYPYREPPPAPPPGGPPPGPPAPPLPGPESTPPTEPTPSPVYVPAPNEAPSVAAPGQRTEGAGQ